MSMLMFGAHMSIAGGVSQALDRASSIGSNAVQIFTKNNRQWKGPPIDEEDVLRWQEEMPKQGIDYAVSHASYLINLASPKDELWEKSRRAHADELQRAPCLWRASRRAASRCSYQQWCRCRCCAHW